MGGKGMTNPPARMKQFTMRVSEEMYENLKQNADAAHLSAMAYTRQLLSNRRTVVHKEIVYNNIVPSVKHISIKNSNYDATVDYFTMQHNEFTNKTILNEDEEQIPRDFYLLDGINCNPYTFNEECQAVNALHGKNQTHSETKAHHYIISFNPRDRDENNLTPEKAHVPVRQFARQKFSAHQMIVCNHRDGHNNAGNIEVNPYF